MDHWITSLYPHLGEAWARALLTLKQDVRWGDTRTLISPQIVQVLHRRARMGVIEFTRYLHEGEKMGWVSLEWLDDGALRVAFRLPKNT